jgi:hypothetical protein
MQPLDHRLHREKRCHDEKGYATHLERGPLHLIYFLHH